MLQLGGGRLKDQGAFMPLQRPTSDPLQTLARAHRAGQSLSILANVLQDQIGRLMLELIEAVAVVPPALDGAGPGRSPRALYSRLFALLADEAELSPRPLVGDAWQNHLLERVLANENALSRKLAQADPDRVGRSLIVQLAQDLAGVQTLFHVSGTSLVEALERRFPADGRDEDWVAWDELQPLAGTAAAEEDASLPLKLRIAGLADWREAVPALIEHYAAGRTGLLGRYQAFRWVRLGSGGTLEGIAAPDTIRLDELIGYETERELLIRNTEWFLEGYPANNVLIYGERGTGKSSTVKALLNTYAKRGLRMIEVSKHDLGSFPAILALVRRRRERFILFVDDLSFEHQETYYKELKAVLEGGLEARPTNMLLYATSNRRHLVQERWSDREGFDHEEVHSRDAMQEKLSLADRFGIRSTFLAPDQERYLLIVEGLARARSLPIGADGLRRRAIEWAQWQNARSGRTARQFVDYLTAELGSARRDP